ncbi:hypothetical protein GCM10010466_04420 [Planomonospora alba]|uniref:Uncharacterized protein n=1 Tax=Planomonospora alba TaxID=161354 RepID=A0ABP6MKN6_9ACTN
MAIRLKTSIEELAWMVDSDPSLPWVIALSMVTISSPRTSPTITREGFMRRERRTSSAMLISPWPSELGNRCSKATTFGWSSGNWSRPSSSARSTVMSRSVGGISLASARSRVVFPALVEPAIMMFFLAATAADRKRPRVGVSVPLPTRSLRKTLPSRARRMETAGRTVTSMTAESRDPSGSRRSSWGFAVSKGRLDRPL